jgi:2-desacetyl-2-hydroxyethyl bacteriochlorophyllide A dehydrogenase
MKAAVIKKAGEMILTDRPMPVLSEGEALIKVKYIGICGSDIHVLKGIHPTAVYPLIPGHEFVGEMVEAKGPEAKRFRPGEIVVAQEIISCGVCDACAKGEDNVCRELKIIGIHTDGGFAQYVKVKTRKMYKIPEDTDLTLAALIEPLAVAVHDVRRSGLKVGETALVVGGGPIGMLVALVAREAGARKVVISEVSAHRLKVAQEMDFDTLNPIEKDFGERLIELSEGRGFDVSFEAAGAPSAIGTCVEHTKNTGNIVIIAMTEQPSVVDTGKVFAKELTLTGVRMHSQYNFLGAVDIVKSGTLNKELKTLITKTFSLDDVLTAFSEAQNGKDNFKILVRVD